MVTWHGQTGSRPLIVRTSIPQKRNKVEVIAALVAQKRRTDTPWTISEWTEGYRSEEVALLLSWALQKSATCPAETDIPPSFKYTSIGFRSLTVNWSRCGFEEASEPTVSLERPLGILQINGTVGQYTIWEREGEGILFWWGQHSHIENNYDKSGWRDVWWAAHRGAADVTETTVLSKQSPERNARETLLESLEFFVTI